eukprot:COSAG06_NODE_55230_length_290_cov_1.335079_1_plen_51_part_10
MENLKKTGVSVGITEELVKKAGGFSWSCEEESIYPIYMNRTDVRESLHWLR